MKSQLENINFNKYFESKKQVVKNNYWNEEHEQILESLQKSCFRLSKEYKQKYFKLRDKLQWYRIPIIIISSIGGFLSLTNTGYIPLLYNKWISLFVGFTNLTVTIISLIESFKKIDSRMNGSYATHVNFQKLHDEIAVMKRIPPNERDTNGNEAITALFTKYNTYFSDAPILRKLINDDIGLNEFDEIITPQMLKSKIDLESQTIDKKKFDGLNFLKNNLLFSSSSNFDKNVFKNNFKSKYNNANFYNNYNFDNNITPNASNENKFEIDSDTNLKFINNLTPNTLNENKFDIDSDTNLKFINNLEINKNNNLEILDDLEISDDTEQNNK